MNTTRVRLPNGKFGSAKHNPTAPIADFNHTTRKPTYSKVAKTHSKANTPVPTAGPAKRVYNIFVIDRSGSMRSYWESVRHAHDTQINKIITLDINNRIKTDTALIVFDDMVDTIYEDMPVSGAKSLMYYNNIGPRASTALYDAIYEAISLGHKMHAITQEKMPIVITVLTDGEENASRHDAHTVSEAIRKAQATDLFTIAFMVPPRATYTITTRLSSVHPGNIVEWELSDRGVQAVSQHTMGSMSTTYSNVMRGVTSTKNFFEVNAKSLTEKAVRTKLVDVSGSVKFLTVDKEAQLNEFIKSKVGSFVRGNAYYQLTKKETFQADKDILIHKRGDTTVYGGPEARRLVGITETSNTVKIEPGNLGDWVVYAQSKSANRILVRGTKLLYKL